VSVTHQEHPQFRKCAAIQELKAKGILSNEEVHQIIRVLMQEQDTLHTLKTAEKPILPSAY
jgi:hypothetical protein